MALVSITAEGGPLPLPEQASTSRAPNRQPDEISAHLFTERKAIEYAGSAPRPS